MDIYFYQYIVRSKVRGCQTSLTSTLGLPCVTYPFFILYTHGELRFIHRHFYPTSTDKLYNFIRLANPSDVTEGVRGGLGSVQASFNVCQCESDAPRSFIVALPGKTCVFNACVSLDLLCLDVRSVLHTVYSDTKLKATCFLNG